MSDELFPKLQGLTWEIKPTPTFSTVVQTSRNRSTTRLMNDPYPLWQFELNYEFVRDSRGVLSTRNPSGWSELEQIIGFYLSRGGQFDNFLLDPGMLTGRPWESQVKGANIGTGDGETTAFQLQRNYGGFMDEVQNPVGTPYISANGIIQTSGWSLGANGIINFTTPPASDVVITADFAWQWRVRFSTDMLEGLAAFSYELYELKTVKLEQDPL